MYSDKFCTAIKVNGKVLRENKNEVTLPFGSEYSILLKNLNTVRAQVKVSIDGNDAVDTGWLILQPNSSCDLERFIKNGNYSSGNRFKFIQRTENIEKHRGIGVDDGIIRIEYKFEKIFPMNQYYGGWPYQETYTPKQPTVWPPTKPEYWPQVTWTTNGNTNTDNLSTVTTNCSGTPTSSQISCNMMQQENNAGITVPGSESHQKFYATSDFICEESKVIILKLVGQIGNKVVEKPITVQCKPICSSCGRTNRATNKFCSECGTSLILF